MIVFCHCYASVLPTYHYHRLKSLLDYGSVQCRSIYILVVIYQKMLLSFIRDNLHTHIYIPIQTKLCGENIRVKRSKEQNKKRLEKIAVLINSQAHFGGCNVQSFKHCWQHFLLRSQETAGVLRLA